jgi:hypothetical protein
LSASVAFTAEWDILNFVVETSNIAWGTLNSAHTGVSLPWSTLNSASASEQINWNVTSNASSVLNLEWSSLSYSTRSFTIFWGMQGATLYKTIYLSANSGSSERIDMFGEFDLEAVPSIGVEISFTKESYDIPVNFNPPIEILIPKQ